MQQPADLNISGELDLLELVATQLAERSLADRLTADQRRWFVQ